jgi:polyisoprenoid-binding protein YceI
MASMVLAGCLVLGAAAQAEPVVYKVEPKQTWTTWEAKHFGVTTFRGRFDKKEGRITLDREAKKGRVEVTIDLTSASSGVEHLDHRLQDPEFFETAKFPTATFVGDEFAFDGEKLKSVTGKLTMHGVTLPVTLRATGFGCFDNPMLKREVCGGDFTATIDRRDWGMNYLAPFPVSADVGLLISVEAVRE